jgi:hypothetical protein
LKGRTHKIYDISCRPLSVLSDGDFLIAHFASKCNIA